MIVLRFFGSRCRETVQTSARISTHSFFDLRMKMLGEMLDRLTNNFQHRKTMLGEMLDEMFDRLTRALRLTQGQVILGTNFPIEDTCPVLFYISVSFLSAGFGRGSSATVVNLKRRFLNDCL